MFHQHTPQININAILAALRDLNINSILVEGGRQVLNEFFTHELVERYETYIVPCIIAGHEQKKYHQNTCLYPQR